MSEVARHAKGRKRRQDIIDAAAALLREGGPTAVTHRAVAARAECSLSATTYYFSGLEDLLAEAGAQNIDSWATRAERVAAESQEEPPPATVEQCVSLLLRACLPAFGSLENHYLQLVAASQSPSVASAYRHGRARLDQALDTILVAARCDIPAPIVSAVVDGAAVVALSEGRDIRATAHDLLVSVLLRGCNSPWARQAACRNT